MEDKFVPERMTDDMLLTVVRLMASGELTKSHKQLFERWYSVPENAVVYESMKNLNFALNELATRPKIVALCEWEAWGVQEAKEKNSIGNKLRRVKGQVKNIVNKFIFSAVKLPYQAKLSLSLIVIALSSIVFFVDPHRDLAYETMQGEIQNIILEDNTEVTLDTSSKLRVIYNNNARNIELLEGRAHFNVAPMPEKPFIIRAGEQRVTAIGTAFSVSVLNEDFVVLLEEGTVEVTGANLLGEFGSKQRLDAGDEWIVRHGRPGIKNSISDMKERLGWTNKTLTFRSTSLLEIIQEVNRYSKIDILVGEKGITDREVDAVYKIGETKSFVKALSDLFGIKFDVDEKGRIVIWDEDV